MIDHMYTYIWYTSWAARASTTPPADAPRSPGSRWALALFRVPLVEIASIWRQTTVEFVVKIDFTWFEYLEEFTWFEYILNIGTCVGWTVLQCSLIVLEYTKCVITRSSFHVPRRTRVTGDHFSLDQLHGLRNIRVAATRTDVFAIKTPVFLKSGCHHPLNIHFHTSKLDPLNIHLALQLTHWTSISLYHWHLIDHISIDHRSVHLCHYQSIVDHKPLTNHRPTTWSAIALQRRREVAPRQENLPHAGLATSKTWVGTAAVDGANGTMKRDTLGLCQNSYWKHV